MIEIEDLILGAGISGLAAGQCLKEYDRDFLIIEKDNQYGGLCSSFAINGFVFEHFIHLSFTTNQFVRNYFDKIPYYSYEPNPFNYYHGMWIKHPAINNLYPLSESEKKLVLNDIKKRGKYAPYYEDNYETWLRYQFGDYFAENFPLVYTRKYWAEEAKNMETRWIGNRIYQPMLDEIIEGMKTNNTPITYYAKEMRFPKQGGFSEYLKNFSYPKSIRLGETVIKIDARRKIVTTDREEYHYKTLYSSIPLTEMGNMLQADHVETNHFVNAVMDLHWTSGYIVSIGLDGSLKRPDLWDYVYDEDILISRFFSPSLMSSSTSPKGCSSIQAEIYTKDGMRYEDEEELLDRVMEEFVLMGVVDKAKIRVKDIQFVKYCNILFDHNIYDRRDKALAVLETMGIIPLGRFGRWEYLWSDQAFLSGYNSVKNKLS